ncbi:hypothetical protein MU582_18610 [Nocardioidaceae bacterium SCSIO 66511]|nr:hypothetical protein MU582_18610 [Nocardioidaceae bacterium SCSIO 66511]
MTRVSAGVLACAVACLVVTACGGDPESDSDDESLSAQPSNAAASDDFTAPSGEVVFDFDVARADQHPAVDAYVAWQTAATESLRERDVAPAVTEGAEESPVRTVERSLAALQEGDLTVPRRMVGRLDSIRSTRRAAILDACLWSPSFDYRVRESGRRVADAKPHWMGAEVRMTRSTGQDDAWIVAGLSAGEDCEGSRP